LQYFCTSDNVKVNLPKLQLWLIGRTSLGGRLYFVVTDRRRKGAGCDVYVV